MRRLTVRSGVGTQEAHPPGFGILPDRRPTAGIGILVFFCGGRVGGIIFLHSSLRSVDDKKYNRDLWLPGFFVCGIVCCCVSNIFFSFQALLLLSCVISGDVNSRKLPFFFPPPSQKNSFFPPASQKCVLAGGGDDINLGGIFS